jgi:OFA family oxalate/formate antiporter-like MFS transporter
LTKGSDRVLDIPAGTRARTASYRWAILAASLLIIVPFNGLTLSFGVFIGPLEDEFGWSRGMISLIPAIAGLIHGPCTVLTGWFTDRHGPKLIVITGAFSVGLGLILTSNSTAPWQLFLFYSVMVGFGTSCAYVPLATTVSRWFAERRGLALGLLTSGIGLGTVILPPLARYLISSDGWRSAYLIIGCALWAIAVAAAFLLKKEPEAAVPTLDGRQNAIESGDPAQSEGLSLSEAVRTRSLWLMTGSLALFTTGLMMVIYHLAIYTEEDLGVPEMTAATFLTVIGGANIAGRLAIGTLSDRVGRKLLFVSCLAAQGLTMIWLISLDSVWTLYLFAGMWGFSYGGVGPMIPATAGELFGLRHMGRIFGLVTLTLSIGGAAGPYLAGAIKDATDSYHIAFLVGAGALLLAAAGVAFLKAPERRAA